MPSVGNAEHKKELAPEAQKKLIQNLDKSVKGTAIYIFLSACIAGGSLALYFCHVKHTSFPYVGLSVEGGTVLVASAYILYSVVRKQQLRKKYGIDSSDPDSHYKWSDMIKSVAEGWKSFKETVCCHHTKEVVGKKNN